MNRKKLAAIIAATEISKKRRQEEVADLFLLEGQSPEEIAEYSVYSLRTIERDIEYILAHPEEFI